jgi:hypothetical protein
MRDTTQPSKLRRAIAWWSGASLVIRLAGIVYLVVAITTTRAAVWGFQQSAFARDLLTRQEYGWLAACVLTIYFAAIVTFVVLAATWLSWRRTSGQDKSSN